MGGIGTFKGGFGFPENEQGNIDGIPFYKVSDMNDRCNTLTMKKASNYVTNSQIIKNNWKPFLNQNVIFAKVGAAVYLERKRKAVGPFLLDNNMMVFQPNNANIDYIYYTFQRLQLSKHAQVGTLPSLNASELEKITIFIPSLAEQKVVADLGVTIDHAITLHEEKKHQLECLKSALLQKMFADKSSYPAVRFVGFKNAWEQCKLSDISEKSYEKNTDNKYSTVLTNSAEYGIVKQRDFFDKDIANSSNISGYYIVRKNYFVYNPRISNQAKFGPINRNKLDETGIMSPLYLVFTVHDIDESFLETLFQTTTWHRFMYQNGDTGARADRFAIKDSTFMSMPIKVPPLEEQHKLALAFQKLDHTITLHDHKLELLKRMKQSLLQKMFI